MDKVINKLLKEINVEKLKNNHKGCIEIYNSIGGSYSEIGEYAAAIEYHEKALETSKQIGDRLGTALALRYMGEAKAALCQFYLAISDIKRYLDLAQKINDKVEIQRAWTTLGRVYLMQAQDMKDGGAVVDERIKLVASKAEKHFETALNLAESVRDQVDNKEFAQMKSGLLVNIGLVKDICGEHRECVSKFYKAIEICKAAKVKEDLFRSQLVLAGIFRQKNNIQLAAKTSEEALNTAKSIGQKLLLCDAYIERGLVKLCLRDFKDAKRNFVQAYFEKSPNEEDHLKAIKLAKLAHLISEKYQQLSQEGVPKEVSLKLCDKLGDLLVAVNCYKLAAEFYKRALSDAMVCNKPRNEIARILYSMAETYADDGQYENAKALYEKEITYRKGNNEEQCQSYIKIAHMHEYLNHEPEVVCNAYEKALEKAGRDQKLVYSVVKDYVAYLDRKSYNQSRADGLKDRLTTIEASYPNVVQELEQEGGEADDLEDEAGNIDEIISDDEENEEVVILGRRRNRGANKFKKNELGETPLHKACIDGQLDKVKSLISRGHEVNPVDNANWTPLHEACNLGHYEIVEYLIEHGADVNKGGMRGMSPLHDAATNGHFEIMRLLIKHGANVIALTDQGQTVLGCLRDYGKRTSNMRDQDRSEYKQMEAELLNIMDQRGFNLMHEFKKDQQRSDRPSSSSAAPASTGVSAQRKQASATVVRPKPRTNMNQVDHNPVASGNSIRDYRNVIGSLKRKRLVEDSQRTDDDGGGANRKKKVSLPATYEAENNPSASTKEWLIDDVSRDKNILKRRTNLLNLESDNDDDEDDDEFDVLEEKRQKDAAPSPIDNFALAEDDDDDDIELIGIQPKQKKQVPILESPNFTPSPPPLSPPNDFADDFRSPSLASINHCPVGDANSNSNWGHLDSTKPKHKFITIDIDDKKIVVPIEDEDTKVATIKWLKENIITRYGILVPILAKPNCIKLYPKRDPANILFDTDPCYLWSNDILVAEIQSWHLDSIERTYVDNMDSEALNYIKVEMRKIDQMNSKLDLSFCRFPREHLEAMMLALAHRDFNSINLTGSPALLEPKHKLGQHMWDMFDIVASWKKSSHISMKCVGLCKTQFETICNKMKFPELKSLDLSSNIIVYMCQLEFKKQVENLRAACPKLKRLDMRKNGLQFVRQEMADEGDGLEILLSDQREYRVTLS